MFQLADRLGMTVARLGREMSHAEFIEWSAYLEIAGLLRKETSKGKSPDAAMEIVAMMIELHNSHV
jgi:hypothetical protein